MTRPGCKHSVIALLRVQRSAEKWPKAFPEIRCPEDSFVKQRLCQCGALPDLYLYGNVCTDWPSVMHVAGPVCLGWGLRIKRFGKTHSLCHSLLLFSVALAGFSLAWSGEMDTNSWLLDHAPHKLQNLLLVPWQEPVGLLYSGLASDLPFFLAHYISPVRNPFLLVIFSTTHFYPLVIITVTCCWGLSKSSQLESCMKYYI